MILIKTTLGMLVLIALSVFATITGKLANRREVVYALVPPVVYLVIAMVSGINIGARHLHPCMHSSSSTPPLA